MNTRHALRTGHALAAAVLSFSAVAAWACGVCAEDKIAATYDHAVVQHAKAEGRAVVFCEMAGRWDAAKVKAAAARLRGVDAASVRVSREPGAVSFALDTKQQTPKAAVQSLRASLKGGAQVALLKVDQGGR